MYNGSIEHINFVTLHCMYCACSPQELHLHPIHMDRVEPGFNPGLVNPWSTWGKCHVKGVRKPPIYHNVWASIQHTMMVILAS